MAADTDRVRAQPDPTAAIYDALAGLQGGPHHLPPGTRQAIAEHLAAMLPALVAVSPPADRAAELEQRIGRALELLVARR